MTRFRGKSSKQEMEVCKAKNIQLIFVVLKIHDFSILHLNFRAKLLKYYSVPSVTISRGVRQLLTSLKKYYRNRQKKINT